MSSSRAALPPQAACVAKALAFCQQALAELGKEVTLPNHSSHLTLSPLALLDCWSLIKAQGGTPSNVAAAHFSPVEGLMPCCGLESTVINQLTMWGEDSAGRR